MTEDVRVHDADTGATLDVETAWAVRADPSAWAATLRAYAAFLRRNKVAANVYHWWRLIGTRNPRNQSAGRIGGTAAVHAMTREQRKVRAAKGGYKVFHGDTRGSDGVRARAYGRLMSWRRWKDRSD